MNFFQNALIQKANTQNLWDPAQVAFILIDYQEKMFRKIRSSDPVEADTNLKLLVNAANE
jgi:nicotinamidase-related amidase